MVSLTTLNGILCILHLCLAIGFWIYFARIHKDVKGTPIDLSIRKHALQQFPDDYQSQEMATPTLTTVEILAVSFFFITAIFHGYYFLTGHGRYPSMIGKKNNFVRWIEYGISSTIMIYIIAMMAGVKDINCYIAIGVLNIGMILQGQMVEQHIANNISPWIPLITGFLLLAGEIAIISREFDQRIHEASDILGKSLPSWLPSMIYILFFMFALFGFVPILGIVLKLPYPTIERIYLWLSLLSKATLGSFLAYGLGQRAVHQEGQASPSPSPPS